MDELKLIWQNELITMEIIFEIQNNLTRLEISECEMVEEVFEIQMPIVEEAYIM